MRQQEREDRPGSRSSREGVCPRASRTVQQQTGATPENMCRVRGLGLSHRKSKETSAGARSSPARLPLEGGQLGAGRLQDARCCRASQQEKATDRSSVVLCRDRSKSKEETEAGPR
ncbi:unnamed protein product [Pleuronectes platessa]|uniref:Uncharacterized protein n=1 Tax=Pleuronectes platessa TaxID=8262 RepID=A0A9N7V6X3_PLEPL|nr:unnamed protein product [Pleuronectes platessa]